MAGNYGKVRNKHLRCFEINLIEMAARYLNDEQYMYYIKEATEQFGLSTQADYVKYLEEVEEMHDHIEGKISKNCWDRANTMLARAIMTPGYKNPYIELAQMICEEHKGPMRKMSWQRD